jgi:hypothetical protein
VQEEFRSIEYAMNIFVCEIEQGMVLREHEHDDAEKIFLNNLMNYCTISD